MDNNFGGVIGASFAGDAVYSNTAGTAPTFVSESTYGQSLLFAAGVQGIISETFTSTTTRVFDRIYLISGAATTTGAILDVRSNTTSIVKGQFSSSNKLQLIQTAGNVLLRTSTNSMPVGTRFRIVFTLSGTNWQADIYADDTTVTILETISGTITSVAVTTTRDGFSTSTGIGTGVSMRLIWPEDGDTTVPGPRPTATVPGAPTAATATAGDRRATVTWTAPASNGEANIFGYNVTASPGGQTVAWTGGALSAVVTNLNNGTAYTFSVTATNSIGTGSASSASNSVTPVAGAYIANLSNSSEGGSNGAGLTNGVATSGAASGDPFDTVNIGTGATVAYTNTTSAHGTLSYAATGNATPAAAAIGWSGLSDTSAAIRMYYNVGSSFPSAQLRIMDVRAGATSALRVFMDTTGKLFIQNAANTTIFTFGTAVALNTWYRVEVALTISASTATIKADYYLLDSVTPVETGYSTSTGNTGAANITGANFGLAAATASTTTSYFDDMAIVRGTTTYAGAYQSPAVPTVPTGLSATANAGLSSATITFTAPSTSGGSQITGYTATSTPGNITGTSSGAATSITVTGLTNGTSYTFTVHATNAVGNSSESTASNSVTPTGATYVANLANGAEGGTNGTGLTNGVATSGAASGDPFDIVNIGTGGTVAYTNTASAHGTLSYAATGTAGGAAAAIGWSGWSDTSVAVRMYYNVGTSYPSAALRIMDVRAGVTSALKVFMGTNGKLFVQDATSTTIFTFATPVSFSTWYRVEVALSLSPTAATIKADYYALDNTVHVESGFSTSAGNTGSTNVTGAVFGLAAATASTTTSFFDDMAVVHGTTSYVGAYQTPAVPTAPTNPVASNGGSGAAIIAFTPSSSSGGSQITGYTATSSPGGFTGSASGSSSNVVVTGLTNGTAYTFTIHATNGIGNSSESTASNSVTPTAAAYVANLANGAEGGTNGTALINGVPTSGAASGDPFDTVVINSGATLAYTNTTAAHGSLSYSVTGSATPAAADVGWSGLNDTSIAVRMYYNVGSAYPSAQLRIMDVRAGVTSALRVYMDTTGKLFLQDTTGTTIFTFGTAVSFSTWYRVEIALTVSASTATIKADYYPMDSLTHVEAGYSTTTGNTGTTNVSQVNFGLAAATASTITSYFDDMALVHGTTTYVGPYQNPTLPTAPTSVVATANVGVGSATVTFTPPSTSGGSQITTYTATSSPGNITSSVGGSTNAITITGLTNGTAYTFTVTATNNIGTGPASSASNSVTPTAAAYIANLANGAEGGTDGVALVNGVPTTGADSGDPFQVVNIGTGGTVAYTSTTSSHGTLSYAATGTSSAAALVGWNGMNDGSIAVRMYYNVGAAFPGAALRIIDVRAGAVSALKVFMGTNGKLFVQNTANTNIFTFATALSLNTWYRVEVALTISASTATIKADYYALDNTVHVEAGFSTTTGNTGTASVTGVNFGQASAAASTTTSYFDDMAVVHNTTTYVGPYQPPAAPTAPSSLVATAGSGSATITFVPPSSSGGSQVTTYTATSSPGGITGTAGAGSTALLVTGLTNGTAYTFTMTATNNIGTSVGSSPSNSGTPNGVAYAANLSNSAEGGTNGTTITAGNSGGTSGDPLTNINIGSGGSFVFSTTTAAHGSKSYAVTGTAGSVPALAGWTGLSDNSLAVRFMYNVGSALPSVAQRILDIRSASASGLKVFMGTNGKLFVQNAASTTIFTSASTFSTSTWYRVEAAITVSPTAATIKFDVYSLDFTAPLSTGFSTTTGNTGSANITTVNFGLTAAAVSTTTSYFDDLAVAHGTTNYIGPYQDPTVPTAPTNIVAAPAASSALITFAPSSTSGGSQVTSYTATSTPGGITGTGSGSGFFVTGLTDGATYTFTVHATNSLGNSPESAASAPVTPSNNTPVANAGFDAAVSTGAVVQLDGSGSYDLDFADTITYAWTHVSGPNSTLSDATAQQPTYTASIAGTDVWSLIVTDNHGAASAADTVTVVAQGTTFRVRRSGVWTDATVKVRRSGAWVPLN